MVYREMLGKIHYGGHIASLIAKLYEKNNYLGQKLITTKIAYSIEFHDAL